MALKYLSVLCRAMRPRESETSAVGGVQGTRSVKQNALDLISGHHGVFVVVQTGNEKEEALDVCFVQKRMTNLYTQE